MQRIVDIFTFIFTADIPAAQVSKEFKCWVTDKVISTSGRDS